MPSSITLEVNGDASTPGKPPLKGLPLPRNIRTVILGDIEFDTWYYSPYPDSLIFSTKMPGEMNGANGVLYNGVHKGSMPSTTSSKSAMCPLLHVCPFCFAYTPSVDAYIVHLKNHRNFKKEDPEMPPVPESAEKVYEHGGYAVYKIDGEKEKLYCQNLSLFGKLFLEQKSVFFDTSGFWYNVLAYTPPLEPRSPRKGRPAHKKSNSNPTEDLGLSIQILGFFSKEKLSWDQNNLACILVFPPFQHRQLGKLLMAVSYKLSGWEWMFDPGCFIGGPEKPLSVMGRKSYLRFWSERIARYVMGQSRDSDGDRLFKTDANDYAPKGHKKKSKTLDQVDLTVKEIGERTGMLVEDVKAALMEMDVCETPILKRGNKKSTQTNGIDPNHAEQEHEDATMIVKRSKVLDWAQTNGVELEDPVKEEGFIGEWRTIEE